MCPSYLATREEKDSTRGRARVLQDVVERPALPGGWRLRGARGAGPVPGLQGLRPRLPDRRRHGDVQGRGAAPEVRRQAAAAHATTPSGGCRSCWRGVAAGGSVANRCCGPTPCSGVAQVRGGDRPAARAAAVLAGAAAGRRAAPGHRDSPDVVIWVDTFTNRFSPEVADAAVAVLEGAGRRVRRGRPTGAVLRADLDQHRPAATRPARSLGRTAARPSTRTSPTACRSSRWSRPAWPCCARTPASCSAATRPAGCAGVRTLAEHLADARLDAAGPERGRGRRPAALPPRLGARLGGRRGAAAPGRRRR